MKFKLPLIKLRAEKDEDDIFFVRRSDQKRTVDELISESTLTQSYYFMLFFAAIITVSGIMMDNALIIIAGMLVAPLLKPILTFSLGIATVNPRLIYRSLAIVTVSSGIVVAVGLAIPLLYAPFIEWSADVQYEFNPLYFLIAVFAGMASAFSWTKQKTMAGVLSGAGIAITLVPPLAAFGILIAEYKIELAKDTIFVYLYNLMTLTAGGALVFALSGFSREKLVHKEIKKQLKKEEEEK